MTENEGEEFIEVVNEMAKHRANDVDAQAHDHRLWADRQRKPKREPLPDVWCRECGSVYVRGWRRVGEECGDLSYARGREGAVTCGGTLREVDGEYGRRVAAQAAVWKANGIAAAARDDAELTAAFVGMDLAKGEAMERLKTEFFKSGDSMAIRTNATDEREFLDSAAQVLSRLIDEGWHQGDWEFQLGFWLRNIVDITCKLRGYKADVDEQRVITAGDFAPADASRVGVYGALQVGQPPTVSVVEGGA